mgnify:CR=1 FL=1
MQSIVPNKVSMDQFARPCQSVSFVTKIILQRGVRRSRLRPVTVRRIRMSKPGRPNITTTWHWCTECTLWRVHTSDEHIIENNEDASEDMSEMIDVIDGVPRLDE